MSESAVMSAEESMRSAMLAKDQANSALTAARQMMDLQLGAEPTGREVVGLQSDQVNTSTSAELITDTAERHDLKEEDEDDDEDTQPVFLSDPAADIVDGGSDSDGEAETAAIVDVLTSSEESEDWKHEAQSHHHRLDQNKASVSQTDAMFNAARPSAVAGPYIPSPSQVGSLIVNRLSVFMIDFSLFSVGFVKLTPPRRTSRSVSAERSPIVTRNVRLMTGGTTRPTVLLIESKWFLAGGEDCLLPGK